MTDDPLTKVLIGRGTGIPNQSPTPGPSTNNPKKRYYLPLSLLLASLLALAGLYGFNQWQKSIVVEAPVNTQIKSESQITIESVSKLISLPNDEEPTIATVSDLEALKGQAFFANAKVGDKVLIYAKAKKAVLYDPTANKVIEVAPLNIKGN